VSMIQRKQMKERRAAKKTMGSLAQQFQLKTANRKKQLGIIKGKVSMRPAPAPMPRVRGLQGKRVLDN
jgi:hypothetical protein